MHLKLIGHLLKIQQMCLATRLFVIGYGQRDLLNDEAVSKGLSIVTGHIIHLNTSRRNNMIIIETKNGFRHLF